MPGHLQQPVQRLLALLATLALSLSALPACASPAISEDAATTANVVQPKGDSIIAVHQNGRTVYVNAEAPAAANQAARPKPRRHSVLVYWSNTERRWKPVPAPSPAAMRAAQTAAAEVHTYIAARPLTAEPSAAASNPNYAMVARGRRVTAAEIDSTIEQAAQKHGVDANLVRAIIKVESNFNPGAVSNKGAMGLMQLMPRTARMEGVRDPFDPQQNVDAGVHHLKQLLSDFKGDVRLTLAAYNAGAGAVTRNKGVPPFSETQNYVKRITDLYWNREGTVFGPANAPVRMYRGSDGVVRMTNTE